MKTKKEAGQWLRGILIFAMGAALASNVRADDCYRYVSYDGASTQIDMTCAQQLGITPIFVRDTALGYDIVVPTWSDAVSSYSLLPAASVQWLGSGTNLNRTQRVIDIAESTAGLYAETSAGGATKIEYVNYTLSNWLNTSGATTAIANIASNSTLLSTECSHIVACTSCEEYHCHLEDGLIHHFKCFCASAGQSCCIINRTLEPPVE